MVRLAQRFESIEYRGDWAAQAARNDMVATPADGVSLALFEASRGDAGASSLAGLTGQP